MGIVPAGSGQNVVIGRRVSHVPADVLKVAADDSKPSSIDKTVNERRVRALIDGLNPSGDGSWLSPVVILEGDHEYMLDFPVFLGACAATAQCSHECEPGKGTEIRDR